MEEAKAREKRAWSTLVKDCLSAGLHQREMPENVQKEEEARRSREGSFPRSSSENTEWTPTNRE